MLGGLFKSKEQKLLDAAIDAIQQWRHADRPYLQVKALRAYEQAFVVRDYYRPSGYVWKQQLDKDLRLERAQNLRSVKTDGRDLHYSVAYYGLLYRLAFFNSEDQADIRAIVLPKGWGTPPTSQEEANKRRLTAFELLMLQHVVQGWDKLAANAEFLLGQSWADTRLKSLAADMAVQAHYEMVRSKIFQNTIEAADLEPAKEAVQKAAQGLGEQNVAGGHYEALVTAMQGDVANSVKLHGSQPVTGYRTQFFRTAAQVQPLEQFVQTSRPHAHWSAQPVWDVKESEQRSCSLIACDQGYFYQFFVGFAESFALQNPGGLLHFHGVGFEPHMDAIHKRVEGLDIEVNVSHDMQNLATLLPDRFKGYCAGARYMYLPFFLEYYDHIIVHDVDGVLTTDMGSIWEDNASDVMISSLILEENRKGHFALWSNIGAGAFAIRRSEQSIKYANALSHYLAVQFDASEGDKRRYFFSDQTGLLLATLAFHNDVSIKRMPQIFVQSSETKGPGRGKAKKEAQKIELEKLKAPKPQ